MWLSTDMCPMETSRDRLRAALLARCRELRIEPPAPGQIEWVLGEADSLFGKDFTACTENRRPKLSATCDRSAVGHAQRRVATRIRSATARERLSCGHAITVVTTGASRTGTATRSRRRSTLADSGIIAVVRPSAIS